MKRLSILAIFLITTLAHAIDKNNLEKAIRAFDVETVKQIVSSEKLTPAEFGRHLALADEMISERKFWVWRAGVEKYHVDDLITPYNGPHFASVEFEFMTGWIGGILSGIALGAESSYDKYSTLTKNLLIAGVAAGVALCIKSIYDIKKCAQAEYEHRTLLRKKYDDAVTIRQLICMAQIIEEN